MRAGGILVAASALALTACAAGPPPEVATPVPVLPDAFLFAPDPSASASLAALMPVADPAFDTLAAQALASSPPLGEAAARVEDARAGAARAGAVSLQAGCCTCRHERTHGHGRPQNQAILECRDLEGSL